MDVAFSLRQKLLNCQECRFSTEITTDFDEEVFQFGMDCIVGKTGDIAFSVTSPTSIAGISGSISADGGGLTFDSKILAFPLVIEEELSPVGAPWIVLNCLRNGYLSSCGQTDDGVQIIIDDTFHGENIQCMLWLDHDDMPYYSEVVWRGRRILTATIENIVIS